MLLARAGAGPDSPWAPMSLAYAPLALASSPRLPASIWVLGDAPDWRWAPMRQAWRPMWFASRLKCSSATTPLDMSSRLEIQLFSSLQTLENQSYDDKIDSSSSSITIILAPFFIQIVIGKYLCK
ncbi:hypothetical protein CCACVL1_04613 [Corchorus capsularis]|uniref:Uncharacterized protein n=1 Tax=Corchorus capsularis TaxID=210143 RepID=A0A1R3JRA1_COCAP|nr:hypothetical protein CCACVL1_04613 [Corchorus capsularis]